MLRLTSRHIFRLAVMLFLLASVLDAGLAQDAESNYSHLKVLEPLLGTWRRTDEPAVGPNLLTAEWITERNHIELRSIRDLGGETGVTAVTVIFWNSERGRIESHSFGNKQDTDSRWTVDGDTVTEILLQPENATIKRRVNGEQLALTMIVEGVPPIAFEFKRSEAGKTVATPEITGAVRVNGKPLPSGQICLISNDGQIVGSRVENGEFRVQKGTAGRFQVTIFGEGVSAEYASGKSRLYFEVKTGRNRFDVELR